MFRATLTGLIAIAATQAVAEDAYLDDRSNPAALIRSLYNAINRDEYARAYSYFANPPAADVETYAKGYDETASVEVIAGLPAEEGAAGSIYYNLPVAIRATGTDGSERIFAGCYTLRIANPAIQADEFEPLHIERGSLRAADGEFEQALPRQCGDGPTLPEYDATLERAKTTFAASKPDTCDASLANVSDDDLVPESHTISFNYEYDSANQPERQARLFRFFCYRGAYNESHVFYFADDQGEVSPLYFASPELDIRYVDDDTEGAVDSIRVIGFSTTAELVNSDYDASTLTISEFSKWRGLGDATSSGSWSFKNGRFRLVHYAVDASYDGEQNPETVIDYETAP